MKFRTLVGLLLLFALSTSHGAGIEPNTGASDADAATAGLALVKSSERLVEEAEWIALHRLEDTVVGVLPANHPDLLDSDTPRLESAFGLLELYDPQACYLLIPREILAALDRGELPGAWKATLLRRDLPELTAAELSSIDVLAEDHTLALVRLPESLRAVYDEPGSRSQRLPTVEERRLSTSRSAHGLPEMTRALRHDSTYWQAVADAVSSDRMFTDLDYLSTTLLTRYFSTPQMELACEYAKNSFDALGLDSWYDFFSHGGHDLKNVVGVKTGTVDSTQIYLICGHLDSISGDPQNSAPGAEDNGSGSAGVLEAARLLASVQTDYTIYFVCFSAEEQGLVGSNHFAVWADNQDLDIRAVLNMDMTGYHDPTGEDLWIEGFAEGTSSVWLMDILEDNAESFAGLFVYRYGGEGFGSDHVPFHNHGFPAVLSIENEWSSYSCYHNTCDTVDQLNPWLWRSITASNVVTLAQLAQVQGEAGALAGTVTVAGGGDPANVTLHLVATGYPERTSDGTGQFSWDTLFPGEYTVLAEKAAYLPASSVVSVVSGETANVELVLEPLVPGSIEGTVYTAEGTPIGGAAIEVEGYAIIAFTGPDGSYTLGPLWPGSLNLCATAAGRIPGTLALELGQAEQLAGVDLSLTTVMDFEDDPEDLMATSGWQWGNDGATGAHSGTNVWGTILNGNYGSCADHRLDLPPISLGRYTDATLSVWVWYQAESGYDGGNLSVTTDGQRWNLVTPVELYDATIEGTCNPLDGQAGFTGNSGGWILRTFPLSAQIPNWVRLRFNFGSDSYISDNGWYIDDLILSGTLTSSAVNGSNQESDSRLAGGDRIGSLHISPSLTNGQTTIAFHLRTEEVGSLAVYAPDGRVLAELLGRALMPSGVHTRVWNGRDQGGNLAPAGIYWVGWRGEESSLNRKVLVVR
ncbi:M28 family peptidase [Candidatus Eisenbacteria bacterium]|uniref:M28 family peptidase n=1 Tax=Eiseniibacteriota bacterium TaxID=2212470 RepID=A0ABV6YJ57_UNCEI